MKISFQYVATILILSLCMSACKKDKLKIDTSKVISTKKIWTANNYSAFTDLTFYNGKWYCVFREADSHLGTIGTLRVLESVDAVNWVVNSVIADETIDLRDPKFLVDKSGFLSIHASSLSFDKTKFHNLYWTANTDVSAWGGPEEFGVHDYWLWQIKQYNGKFYSFGYWYKNNAGGISLFSTPDSPKDTHLYEFDRNGIDLDGCPTEADFVFQKDGKMVVIARTDCGTGNSMLGISSPPYKTFEWHDSGTRLHSPCLAAYNDQIYVCGRNGDRTSVYTIDFEKTVLKFYSDVPSERDSGYPGLVVKDNTLVISYYSADGPDYRAIYLSKVKL